MFWSSCWCHKRRTFLVGGVHDLSAGGDGVRCCCSQAWAWQHCTTGDRSLSVRSGVGWCAAAAGWGCVACMPVCMPSHLITSRQQRTCIAMTHHHDESWITLAQTPLQAVHTQEQASTLHAQLAPQSCLPAMWASRLPTFLPNSSVAPWRRGWPSSCMVVHQWVAQRQDVAQKAASPDVLFPSNQGMGWWT